ncbi:MAG: acyl-CoA dehydrogenase family protein, partial [Jiangellaceae bacterium]
MGHYKSNLRDLEFTLFDVLGSDALLGRGRYEAFDVDTVRSILAEIDRMARDELAESYVDADRHPPVYDPEQRTLTVPDSFRKSYRSLMDSEVWRFALPEGIGGTPLPPSVFWGGAELILGSNAAAWMYSSGPAFASVVWKNGTDAQKRIAELMIERGWGATMVLTEPDAGSDVGAGRTKATRQDDGTWRIEGVKRFITSGEHDMA